MKEEKKAMLALLAAYSIFGLSFLFSKKALNVTSPMILLCARFTVTFLALNLLALMRVIRIDLRGKKLGGPVLLGILQPVLYFVFENYGLNYTTTSFTGMLSSISPVFTAVLGAVLLKEKTTLRQWLFIGMSIAGVLLVSVKSSAGESTLWGVLCLAGAYLSGSLYTLLSRRLSKAYTPFELTYVMFAVGFVFFAGGAFVQNGSQTLPMMARAAASSDFVTAVLFLSLLSSVGAFALINYSLARLPVARAAIFNNVTAVVSLLAGVMVMHDPFTLVNAAAFVLILAGVWGVNRFAQQ